MKPITIALCILSVVATSTAMSQDYSSFVTPTGFQLPPIRSSQFVLTLSPRFSKATLRSSTDGSSVLVAGAPVIVPPSSSDYLSSYFRITSAAYYGISEDTTVYADLEYVPEQKLGTSTATSGTALSTTDYRQKTLSTSLILAHRIHSRFEISAAVSLSDSRHTAGSSTTNSRNYDFSLNVVLLGD